MLRCARVVLVSLLVAGLAGQRPAFSLRIEQDATFTVSCRGTPVVESTWCGWGPNWGWVEIETGATRGKDGAMDLTGAVRALGLVWRGTAKARGTRLDVQLQLTAERDLDDLVGVGIEFAFRRQSRALGGEWPEPDLRGDRSGWSWAAKDRPGIEVAFRPPLAEQYPEGGGSRVRCFFVGKKLARGKHERAFTITLPKGSTFEPSPAERYGPGPDASWFEGALSPLDAPVDLSFLNADDRPAGRRGRIRVEGDKLVFGDGTEARLWGGNLAAYALFVDPAQIPAAAKRIARLGYNLMRIHHHDSANWVEPTVIDKNRDDSQRLDPEAVDRIDRWVTALADEGVYVWLDLHVGRVFKEGDRIEGFAEIARTNGEAKGFCYVNERVRDLMAAFQDAWLAHVNPYRKLAYKDDPAIAGVLLTNENDLTHHFGHLMLPDKNNPHHHALFAAAARDFGKRHGTPADPLLRTWEPGPSKVFLNDLEHRFGSFLAGRVRALGMDVPIATTSYWGDSWLCALPALTAGSVIDAHSYGAPEALSVDPRYAANWLSWIGAAHVHGRPLTITEWNVPYPAVDRFTAPAYLASVACLQGWDAPMIYNYSQIGFAPPDHADTWSTFYDPALQGAMPAAAVLFRRGHVRPATKAYCLQLDVDQLYGKAITPEHAATVRTLLERSRVTIGLPDHPQLDWDGPTKLGDGVIAVRDPDRDFLGDDATEVVSDTGELRRDWRRGLQVIDTPCSQAVNGFAGGTTVTTRNATFALQTGKAFVAFTSLDDQPLAKSRRILLTAVARAEASPGNRTPYRSEPVRGALTLATEHAALALVPLRGDGTRGPGKSLARAGGKVTIELGPAVKTHWFLLEAK